jgi:hypothetical protein
MRLILLAAALCAALPAAALRTRADRDDAEYLELATRYPAAIEVAPGVEGVLVAPRWILTSASAVKGLDPAKARHPVQATFVHPQWRGGIDADLALVFLRAPVGGVEPAPISRDRDEMDDVVRMAAHGGDGRLRAAINTVDRVTASTLALRLKPPTEASDLQGELSASERGAPLFAEISKRIVVTGIFSTGERGWQVFVRVSTYADWIDDTMSRAAIAEANK